MKYKVKRVHFAGMGGTATNRKQGPATLRVAGCDRPRAASAAGRIEAINLDDSR